MVWNITFPAEVPKIFNLNFYTRGTLQFLQKEFYIFIRGTYFLQVWICGTYKTWLLNYWRNLFRQTRNSKSSYKLTKRTNARLNKDDTYVCTNYVSYTHPWVNCVFIKSFTFFVSRSDSFCCVGSSTGWLIWSY